MPETGVPGEVAAVIDIGCTQCLISSLIIEQLGIRAHLLNHPICFEKVNGSLIGGTPATRVTELTHLIHSSPKMTESVILGFAWLDKWAPIIRWEDGYRKIRIGIGPLPPVPPGGGHMEAGPHQQEMATQPLKPFP